MNSHIAIVLGHGKVQPIVNRLIQHLEIIHNDVVLLTAHDDPAEHAGETVKLWKSGRIGDSGVERTLGMLRYILQTSADFATIFEYDTVCLLDYLPSFRGLHGIMGECAPDPQRFISPRYVLSPWTVDRGTVSRMLDLAGYYLEVTEEGNADRLLAAWAHLAGIPILGYKERCYGVCEVSKEMLSAIRRSDVKWIHGIKEEQIFRHLAPL